jgi:hypothetical protein
MAEPPTEPIARERLIDLRARFRYFAGPPWDPSHFELLCHERVHEGPPQLTSLAADVFNALPALFSMAEAYLDWQLKIMEQHSLEDLRANSEPVASAEDLLKAAESEVTVEVKPPCSCFFISGSHVLPGWGCCRCRQYNGLQRHSCRACGHFRGPLDIPSGLWVCGSCGFGLGTEPPDRDCPSCGGKNWELAGEQQPKQVLADLSERDDPRHAEDDAIIDKLVNAIRSAKPKIR